jgi:putative aldouronate transport system substrate-binding protein
METEQFNLLLASGNMPDIVEYTWATTYNAGPDAAIRNRLALSLNSVMDTWAADFKKLIGQQPAAVDKELKTDEGQYWNFPMTQVADRLLTTAGPIIREDWLDDLGLAAPETIDELTAVLRAFKERKGATAAMTLIGGNTLNNIFYQGAIVGAYRTYHDMYRDGNQIKYGPMESGYRQAVAQMNAWYREGLLDQSFASGVQRDRDTIVLNNQAGVTFGMASSSMDMLNRSFKDMDPNSRARLRAFKYPAVTKGQLSIYGHRYYNADLNTAVVNPRSSNTETAVKFLNYGFTERGFYYYNFGTEGVSYNMVNNYPTMVPSILNPPSGSVGAAWCRYARGPYNGPFLVSPQYHEQYLAAPYLDDSLKIWAQTEVTRYMLPRSSISVDESRTYNRIKTDLNSYVLEWTTKAISGSVNINEFETVYLRTLREIGVDQAIAIQQAALERYNRR